MNPEHCAAVKADLDRRIPGVVWTVGIAGDRVEVRCEWPMQHRPPLHLGMSYLMPEFPHPFSIYADMAMASLRAYWTRVAMGEQSP